MKRILRFLMVFVIVIVSLVALVYGAVFIGHKLIFPVEASSVPTIEGVENNGFKFGVQFQKHDAKMEDFIITLAEQIKIYNDKAKNYWPNNSVLNQYVIAESIESGKCWLLSPDGTVKDLTMQELNNYNAARMPYNDGFGPFEGNGIAGVYLALSEEDLNNALTFQKYLHMGTYDVFITYAHELFHMLEQSKWAIASNIANAERNALLEAIDARAKRYLLRQQLMLAISDPSNRENMIINAVSTYKDYKAIFPEDARDTAYLDRIEGTAFYYELISSLYSAYPEQVKNDEDLYAALELLLTREDVYLQVGAGIEGYTVGAFAGILLDLVETENKDKWKDELMKDSSLSPMDILEMRYADTILPEPIEVSAELKFDVERKIAESEKKDTMPDLFRMLYQLLF